MHDARPFTVCVCVYIYIYIYIFTPSGIRNRDRSNREAARNASVIGFIDVTP